MFDAFVPLFLALTTLLLVTLARFRLDFMQPSVIVASMMTLSTFLALLTAERWQLSMSLEGCLFIVGSTAAFIAGGCFAQHCLDRPPPDIAANFIYELDNTKIFLTALVMSAMAALNLHAIYVLSVEHGNYGGLFNMFAVLRPLIEHNELVFDRWISWRSQLAQYVAFTFCYMFAFNLIFGGVRRWLMLLPVVCYLPFPILSTARLAVFFFAIGIISISLILYQKKHRFKMTAKLRAARYLIVGGVMFVAVFFVMGALFGKSISEERTPFVILAHYVGLSIPALDELIHREIIETSYIGSHSLHGIYRALQKFDEELPSVPLFDPFVKFVGIDTNVYTTLGHYWLDYGCVGTLLLMWILGAGYTFLYLAIKRRRDDFALPLMFYGAMSYPLFLTSISERVMFDLIGTTSIYALILLWLSSRIFMRRIEHR